MRNLRYMNDRGTFGVGLFPRIWGLGFLVGDRELSIAIGPLFLWWTWDSPPGNTGRFPTANR